MTAPRYHRDHAGPQGDRVEVSSTKADSSEATFELTPAKKAAMRRTAKQINDAVLAKLPAPKLCAGARVEMAAVIRHVDGTLVGPRAHDAYVSTLVCGALDRLDRLDTELELKERMRMRSGNPSPVLDHLDDEDDNDEDHHAAAPGISGEERAKASMLRALAARHPKARP